MKLKFSKKKLIYLKDVKNRKKQTLMLLRQKRILNTKILIRQRIRLNKGKVEHMSKN